MTCMLALAAGSLAVAGCTKHTIEFEPIHMTLDVNIRVDRELEEFFDFEDEAIIEPVGPAPALPPATEPATAPTTAPAGATDTGIGGGA